MSKTAVLICEDEAIVAADLALKVEQLGHEVVGTVDNGQDAIALTLQLNPDLVLMDIWLKGPMDGIEAADRIRRERDIPVVFLTAHSDPVTLERAKLSGPFGYILKPFEMRELATQIEMALYRHHADRQLREQREWFRVTLTSIGDAVIATDVNGRVTFMNAVAEETTGWKLREAIGLPVQKIFHIISEASRKIVEDPVSKVLATGRIVGLANHTLLIRKDGTEVAIDDSGSPITDQQGNITGVVLVFRDITEKRRAEEALRESEARLRLAMDAANAGSWEWDLRTNENTWSPETFRLYGLIPDHHPASYDTWRNAIDPRDRAEVETDVQKASQAATEINIEWRICLPEGSERWLMSRGRPVRDDSGDLVRYRGIVLDITDRKRMEDELRQARAELEKRVQERTQELSDTVQTIREQSDHLRRITAQLNFAEQRERQRLAQVLHDGLQQILVGAKYKVISAARSQNVPHALSEVTELIDDAIETSRSLTAEISPPILLQGNLSSALEWLARWMHQKHDLEVHITAGETGILPEGMNILFFQAARELLFNVVKHAGIRSARIELSRFDDHLLLSVEDEGNGFLVDQHLQKGGTGLISMKERFSYLGGRVEIDSAPGKGSRFRLIMPLAAEQADRKFVHAHEHPKISVETSSGIELSQTSSEKKIRIVLVDDHMVVRQGLAGLLREEADFDVIGEASDAESAIKLVHKVRPDVVLMDISLPGMDGIEATKIICKDHPEICVIGLSMFQEQEQEIAMLSAGAVAYIPKSGPAAALIETIRRRDQSPKDSKLGMAEVSEQVDPN